MPQPIKMTRPQPMTFHYGGRAYSEADIKAALDFHVRQTGRPARAESVLETIKEMGRQYNKMPVPRIEGIVEPE